MPADERVQDGYIRGVNPAPHPNPLPASGAREFRECRRKPLAPLVERGRSPARRAGRVRACREPDEIYWMTDATDIRRKRLLYRSWHRGTREADLLLGGFADA